jgi:hypothetical protein
VVVVVGAAFTELPTVADNPVAGLQLYEAALPLAVSVVLLPLHMETDDGETEIVGIALTVTDAVTVAPAQPPDAGIVYVIV